MARVELRHGLRWALESLGSPLRPQCHDRTISLSRIRLRPSTSRYLSTTPVQSAESSTEISGLEKLEKFTAAPRFKFDREDSTDKARDTDNADKDSNFLRKLRVVPASPSYFSAKPTFHDDIISLTTLLRKVVTLPTIPPSEAPKVAWKTIDQYRIMTNEPVKTQRFHRMLHILRRLNCIHPSLMPQEVVDAMLRYKKDSQPGDIKPKPGVIDELGRAKGVGRRKTSSATAWIVEGEGEVLVNGKSLAHYFGRLHDRESAVWALKASQRLDKYNIFALTSGGGVTGQAEALTLAVAKALLVHEPALKPVLRQAGCVTRDPRKVERKKPGHVKARKMPAWVKR
ncbi:ribosomal protein S5 domain 2-type protein [Dendryphion nanum]|uniref:Small ribosomal subunit protein uS9m n=1 Tax=Dendryphion nanum TaxID=256645 RepID=A0A9P9DXW8_9PLEO|nr:ribosomal protein S5 domain 2-type protein [Dendryphion nanum]